MEIVHSRIKNGWRKLAVCYSIEFWTKKTKENAIKLVWQEKKTNVIELLSLKKK